MIDRNNFWMPHWDVLEHFLAQCAIQFPHSFDYVARVISWCKRTSKQIDTALWIDVAKTTALQAGSIGRDSEALWAIWLLKELGTPLPIEISDAICGNCNGLILSFLAHFPSHSLAEDPGLINKLLKVVDDDVYSGAYWPLTLELNHLGHTLPSNPSSKSAILRTLHEAKLSIIRWDAAPRIFPPTWHLNATEDAEPDHAIEDYIGDYGGEDENDDGKDDDFGGNDLVVGSAPSVSSKSFSDTIKRLMDQKKNANKDE